MVICLTSARFNMRADILNQGKDNPDTPDVDESQGEYRQDPDSGEIIRVWETNTGPGEISPIDTDGVLSSFRCLARGIVDGGIRVAGTTERFSDMYEAADYVRIWFPSNVKLTRRDRITNIRDPRGNILWLEEENENSPTIFGVVGITPLIDPFGKHIESMALLERAEAQ